MKVKTGRQREREREEFSITLVQLFLESKIVFKTFFKTAVNSKVSGIHPVVLLKIFHSGPTKSFPSRYVYKKMFNHGS